MKSFRQFISESQWMYHGTTRNDLESLTPNRDDSMIDRAIGSHFAADKRVSDKFSKDLYGGSNSKGSVYKTRSPHRSKLLTIHQKIYPHGEVSSDQSSIGAHVSSTVFSHPDNKHMFIDWVKNARRVNDEIAHAIYDKLSKGKAPADKKFGTAASKNSPSFFSYMKNLDSGLHTQPRDGFKREVIDSYLKIMKSRGIKGLVYKNTSPREMEGIPKDSKRTPRPKNLSGSNKSYILFNPNEHEHPLIKIDKVDNG